MAASTKLEENRHQPYENISVILGNGGQTIGGGGGSGGILGGLKNWYDVMAMAAAAISSINGGISAASCCRRKGVASAHQWRHQCLRVKSLLRRRYWRVLLCLILCSFFHLRAILHSLLKQAFTERKQRRMKKAEEGGKKKKKSSVGRGREGHLDTWACLHV